MKMNINGEAYEILDSDELFYIIDELLAIKNEAIQNGGYTKEKFDREEELLIKYYKLRG